MSVKIYEGSALDVLRTLPTESVQCVVTSPPYFGLRAYGTAPQVWGGDPSHEHEWGMVPSPGSRSSDTKPGPMQHPGNTGRERLTSDVCPCGAWRGELGLEPTPALFIEHLVAIFEEVRRVLRTDGLLFCNLSDSYANDAKWGGASGGKHVDALHGQTGIGRQKRATGVPAKSLFLIPQRFAIAMQDAGWIVRQEIVWAKKSCMPESVRDRFTRSWEPVFMFSKSARYFFDQDAVKEPALQPVGPSRPTGQHKVHDPRGNGASDKTRLGTNQGPPTANMRDVWLLGPEPSRLEHYAGFVTEIPRRCILAGTSEKGACPSCGAPWLRVVERAADPPSVAPSALDRYGTGDHGVHRKVGGQYQKWLDAHPKQTLDWRPSCVCPPADPVPCVVLDPFLGSGTTLVVASRLGRSGVGIELNPDYAEMARKRIDADAGPMFDPSVTVEPAQQLDLLPEAI